MQIRKIVLILLALNLLVFVNLMSYTQSANASVISKPAVAVAKKVAKETATDLAVQMAEEIIFNYQMEQLLKPEYAADAGYEVVCLDKDKTKGKCDKPAQIKGDITTADKEKIAEKVETVIERKTGTSGWGKFLDYIVPIFLVGGAASWIAHQFSGDENTFLESIAKESLEETGMLKPVVGNFVVGDMGTGVTQACGSSGCTLTYEQVVAGINRTFNFPSSSWNTINYPLVRGEGDNQNLPLSLPNKNMAFSMDIHSQSPNVPLTRLEFTGVFKAKTYPASKGITIELNSASSRVIGTTLENHAAWKAGDGRIKVNFYDSVSGQLRTFVNGDLDWRTISLDVNGDVLANVLKYPRKVYVEYGTDAGTHIRDALYVFGMNGHFYMVDLLIDKTLENKTDFTYIQFDTKGDSYPRLVTTTNYQPINSTVSLDKVKPTSVGVADLPALDPNRVTVMPSPSTVPLSTPGGIAVKPSPDSSTGWVNAADNTPIQIIEDDLVVGDVDTSQIQEPKPSPTPVVPTAPPSESGGEGENEFENDFVCDKDLKEIEFDKVGTAFTNAFPFSIPWDIKRFIDNSFGAVGDEKPSVELDFLGDGIVLTVPKMIDDWMPFVRTVLLLLFDLSVIYLFVRFMRGGSD